MEFSPRRHALSFDEKPSGPEALPLLTVYFNVKARIVLLAVELDERVKFDGKCKDALVMAWMWLAGIMTLTSSPCELDNMSLFQDLKLKRRKVDSRCSSDGKIFSVILPKCSKYNFSFVFTHHYVIRKKEA
ncbi:hypothetical protein KM043_015319 [Ampulex compressa]|nr:hypothetical protein KM043_015319 [Ampulex compressa]